MPVKQDSPLPSYDGVACGEIAGATSATQLPSVPVQPGVAYLRAQHTNAGKVYVGGAGVTKADGATDTTSGIALAAGELIGPLVVTNLNVFYRICDNAGDALSYLVTQ